MNAATLSNYPLSIQGMKTANLPERFLAAVERLERGLEAGAIPNPEFQDAKYILARGIEEAWSNVVSDPYFHAGRYKDQPQLVQEVDWAVHPSGPHDIPPAAKRVKAALEKCPDSPALLAMKSLLDEFTPLSDMVIKLKPMIVKRKLKTDAEREAEAKYVPPMVSKGSQEKVHAALTKLTNDAHGRLVDTLIDHYESYVRAFIAKSREEGEKARPGNYMVSRCVKDTGSYGHPNYVLEDDWMDKVIAQSKKDADEFRERFVIKSLRKLTSIIDAKGNLTEVKVVGSRIDLAGLSGILDISFDDGASFRAVNSVVFSISIHGRVFARFPLTFHNVTLADGTRMPRPSEERMNTVFAAAGEKVEREDSSTPLMRMAG